MKRNAIIIGAAGRDFHNFNTFFRKNKDYRVVAFTASDAIRWPDRAGYATFAAYPHIGTILPAMGYSDRQLKDLETTINRADCDTVVIGTPIDLNRLIHIQKPVVRVHYDLQEIGTPTLNEVLDDFVKRCKLG